MEYSLELKQAEKRLGTFQLQPLTMAVPSGSILGLIGENGAGKTTLLKLILHIFKLDGGSIEVLGMDSEKEEKYIKERIGFVPDSNMFYDMFTPKDIQKVLKRCYTQWEEGLFFRYLEQFEIAKEKKVSSFSMGMKKKLSIAAALSHHPEILLLDEPMNGLDPVARGEMRDVLQEFVLEESHTVVLSSHITEDLEKIADTIAFLQKGHLLFYENKDILLENYGIFRCEKDIFPEISDKNYVNFRKNAFGYEILLENRKEFVKQYSGAMVEPANLEEIMTFYSQKGAKL